MKLSGRMVLGAYRTFVRVRNKGFTVCVSGAFASMGRRTVIELPVRIVGEAGIALGDDVFVGAGAWLQVLGGDRKVRLRIGDGTSMAGGCVVSAAVGIDIGRRVLIARNVYISDHSHAFGESTAAILDQGIERVRSVSIGDGAWLGENVVVGPGVRIGRGAVVGANAVVLTDIPDRAVAVGAPARVVRMLDGLAAARAV